MYSLRLNKSVKNENLGKFKIKVSLLMYLCNIKQII